MTEREQLINALESVEIYLRNQELSEIGMQVKGKVIEALNQVNKNFIKSDVSGSLLAPSLDKRLAFAEELVTKIDGDMPVSAILATTYWMQAEMINLNKQ